MSWSTSQTKVYFGVVSRMTIAKSLRGAVVIVPGETDSEIEKFNSATEGGNIEQVPGDFVPLLRRYRVVFGAWPRLFPPISFNEHILHRIIYDRDPRLKVICDKVAVRKFVRDKVGSKYVLPLIGVYEHLDEIEWQKLPVRFVLKPSHASGSVRFIDQSRGLNRDELSRLTGQWLANEYLGGLEWGYRGIPRRLLVEPFLQSADGRQALEIEIHTFYGKAALVQLILGAKFTPNRRHTWFDVTGRRVALNMGPKYRSADITLRRDIFHSAVKLVELASADFSFLRVDLFLTSDGLKIAELTPYTNTGFTNWIPRTHDELLGMLWKPDFDLSIIPDFTRQTV